MARSLAAQRQAIAQAIIPRNRRRAHPFFTAQPNNVVEAYIRAFSEPGEIILDPFCGSGVTPYEALLAGRRAIALDLVPLSCVVTKLTCLALPDLGVVDTAFADIKAQCAEYINGLYDKPSSFFDDAQIDCWYPRGIHLPANSDATYVEEIFTRRNLLALGHLLEQINTIDDEGTRFFFRGVFSGMLHRASRTYYLDAARAGGGNSSILTHYRYWIPEKPDERNVWGLFEYRYKTRLRAHLEDNRVLADRQSEVMILQGDARELPLHNESVHYIYADPPYVANIQYVGLSTMWHAWLGHPTDHALLEREIVEGGDLDKDDMAYMALLADTFPEMHRVLAWDRYLSFVFAHKRIVFWDTIIKAAEAAGFQYVNTVVQPTKRPSYHKINNPLKVLSGELIINFCKKRTPSVLARQVMGADIVAIVRNAAERAIVEHQGAKTEEIYHGVIPELLENGLLGEVADEMPDLTPILNEWFDYDAPLGEWYIRPSTKIGSAIPLSERLRFYLKDFLIRCQRDDHCPSFDEIVFEIMPKLSNGPQPRDQEMLDELQKMAVPVDEVHWTYRPELVLDLELDKPLGLPPLTPLSEQRILGGDPHNEMIYRLAKLGIVAGYQVHIGKREQSERWHGEDFAQLSLADLPLLPALEGRVGKAVKQIDCLWLESSGWPVFAFEVEESTAITSGIDRFIEVLKVDPNLAGRIALVVPFRRRRKLNQVLSQSHYIGAPMYMENKIVYLYYRDVVDVYKKLTGRDFEKKDLYKAILSKTKNPAL